MIHVTSLQLTLDHTMIHMWSQGTNTYVYNLFFDRAHAQPSTEIIEVNSFSWKGFCRRLCSHVDVLLKSCANVRMCAQLNLAHLSQPQIYLFKIKWLYVFSGMQDNCTASWILNSRGITNPIILPFNVQEREMPTSMISDGYNTCNWWVTG